MAVNDTQNVGSVIQGAMSYIKPKFGTTDYRGQQLGTAPLPPDAQLDSKRVIDNTKTDSGTATVQNSQKSVAQGANNGTTTQQPVKRNVFGKGMTIEQKQANEDANSRATDNDFLQAAASDNLEGHRYEQDVINHGKDMAIYNADAPDLKESEKKLYDTKAPVAPDYNTHHVEDFQRQQQSQLNWGADPSKVANSSKNRDKEPTSWQELRDQLYGSEAERERKANNNAKVLAVGDALRHIGNLATTAWGHATPQQYKTSPAQDTLDTYKTEREQRDAKAYQYWNNLQSQKQKELENERKNAELEEKKRVNDANIANKNADTAYKKLQTQFNLDTYEPRVREAVYNAVKAEAEGNTAGYKAEMAKIDFEKYPELKALEIQGKKLDNGKKSADIAETKQRTAKLGYETTEAKYNAITAEAKAGNAVRSGGGDYNFPVPKANYKDGNWMVNKDAVIQNSPSLLAQLKKNGKIGDAEFKELSSLLGSQNEESVQKAWTQISSHYKEPEVQAYFKRYSTEANTPEQHTTPKATPKSGSKGSKGSKGGNSAIGKFSIHGNK